jgi:predicted nucleotide-binding protein
MAQELGMYGDREQTEWFDVMQACMNGHIITDSALTYPAQLKPCCPRCGEKTITMCPKCETNIQGFHHIPGVGHPGCSQPPAYCHKCGTAYPWAASNGKDQSKTSKNNTAMKLTPEIFVVHGHDEEMKQRVARALECLDLKPIILHEQSNGGKTIIEKFELHADVSFAIVLLSPDDFAFPSGGKAEDAKARARQNVVLELGYFVGKLGRAKVFSLKRGDIELPSDLSGVIYTPYDSAGHWRLDLVKELKAAGYQVDANKLIETR